MDSVSVSVSVSVIVTHVRIICAYQKMKHRTKPASQSSPVTGAGVRVIARAHSAVYRVDVSEQSREGRKKRGGIDNAA